MFDSLKRTEKLRVGFLFQLRRRTKLMTIFIILNVSFPYMFKPFLLMSLSKVGQTTASLKEANLCEEKNLSKLLR